MQNRKIVISGGPGTGKTSLIKGICNQGYTVFKEYSRTIIEEGKLKGKANFFLSNPYEFSELLFLGRKEQFEKANSIIFDSNRPYLFFDRAIHDTYAYLDALGKSDFYWKDKVSPFKYDLIFLLDPWKSIYKKDAQRMETFEEALEYFPFIKKAYEQNHSVVIVPKVSIEKRVAFILNYLKDWNE